jgi:hypothetical protein
LLIIHIGTHKTGTSALQTFLTNNAAPLVTQGVRYIEAGREGRIAHHPLAWIASGRADIDPENWAAANRELARSGAPIDILSSEAFWFADPAQVRRNLAYDGEIQVVAYLRRQDAYLPSLYKQAVTAGRKVKFETWLDQMGHRGDYYAVLSQWADAFGADAIRVKPYERNGETVDLVHDFIDGLGIDSAAALAHYKPHRRNPSPRRELLHFIRAFNRLNFDIDQQKLFYALIKIDKNYVRSADLLTKERAQELLDRFAESNRNVAARFWHDDTVPLFPDTPPRDRPPGWSLEDPEFMELTVNALDAIVNFVREQPELKKRRKLKKPVPKQPG